MATNIPDTTSRVSRSSGSHTLMTRWWHLPPGANCNIVPNFTNSLVFNIQGTRNRGCKGSCLVSLSKCLYATGQLDLEHQGRNCNSSLWSYKYMCLQSNIIFWKPFLKLCTDSGYRFQYSITATLLLATLLTSKSLS